jgi:GNAT superfamily N-acetyltransferase
MIVVRRLTRDEAEAAFDDLARLRIEVFYEFPYLYEGDLDYERQYISTFMKSPGAVVIGAFDGAQLVGAATASPLVDHFDEFGAPFATRGLDPADYFYFGESVLRKDYRGQGIGVRFFEEREAAARDQGFGACVFASVIRSKDHPRRPADYSPLNAFWAKRGYQRIEGLETSFSWRDIGDEAETAKPMEFWSRQL